jgi:hypothetical protein
MTSDEEVARRARAGPPTLAEGSSTTLKTGSAAASGVSGVVLSTCMQGGSAATSGVSQAGADRGGASAHDGASARDGAIAHGGAFLSELRKRMFPKTRAPK